ncbi:hypothetical protein QA612_17545 [Evansella sp. AB-P1]|uniref:lipoprotein n=1 Tax=Evansella sp. AB-P1 TaxID=3037653 RepID=UPI00241C4581|nr:lipoprotein [Evansella sp. AB-P1]MDG5789267.1 hypothetical protein [Evansella sp. AB-P1]
MRKLLFVFTTLILLSACNSTANVFPKEKPDDFAFSLKYGITAANELNTYDNTFTKDLIQDGTATTDMELSNEEMEAIYEKFRSVDVLSLPEEESGSPCMDPYNRYELTMTVDGEQYNLEWDTSCTSRALNKWEDTMEYIILDIIFTKEEYRALPEATGGYD